MLFVKAGLIALFAVSVSAAARNAYFDGLYARSLDHSALFARGDCGCPDGTEFRSANDPSKGPCYGKCLKPNGERFHRNPATQSSCPNKGDQSCGQAGGNEPGGQDVKQGGAGGSRQKNCPKGMEQNPHDGKCRKSCRNKKTCPKGMEQDLNDCKCKQLNKRSLGWSEDEFDLAARDADPDADADPEADAEFDFDDELLYSRDFLDEFYGGEF
ncbi:MAG: hypothetical protein LQ340_005791 [Diploschistes diacapsis]|nr:MAG: hypothetical protein LQ340_005791 [Diploschistes diacapsis]